MSAILEFYQSQIKNKPAPLPGLAEIQRNALQAFRRLGFPTRHHEEWKYTLVDPLLQYEFHSELPADSGISGPATPEFGIHCGLNNGSFYSSEAVNELRKQGVIVESLLTIAQEQPERVSAYLQQTRYDHGFQALNAANLNSGLFIYIPADLKLEEPLVINYWQDLAELAVHSRTLIILEKNASAAIVESWQGKKDCVYLSNQMTEVYLAEQAELTHYKIQQESKKAFHIGQLTVQQAYASRLKSHSLSLGGRLVRSDINIALQESKAECLMNGIYAPADSQHIDHHTVVNHRVPECRSAQDYKGIMAGKSRAVFNGKVIVAPGAQHTEAQQQNKNLLLSGQSEVNTKPQLEIFADDVICSHGATVGQLDEDALFYLATRGIGRQEASRYLIQAFAAENLRLIDYRPAAEWIANLINQQLEEHYA
ncbi:ABC transporter permease [Legionella birminghamensis]|uniref:ABC transporter permease n=1 Tax=Legionella birminghamensis TaxID=28083 RepID=A0A378IC27_9GAMM|nr:Fe-S cluster assembly protein SufD [Legionella birminghamensis]KTC74309.1 ABC transporter permease [Legionella birminghamensis]STX32573.1 ABC transporter permease [Legionella birminghamensis]